MAYTNSKLVSYTLISPNKGKRTSAIKKITIHHMAGNLSVETCGRVFQNKDREASSNYGIGSDGRIGMYVEEKDRSWCSSNYNNDNQAITIEVANDVIGGDWHVSDKALESLINLCVDICRRNNIKKLNFTGDKTGNLTQHNYFDATACPGPYLKSKFPYIAEEVNKRLGVAAEVKPSTPTSGYLVKVNTDVLNVRAGASTKYKINTQIKRNEVYTIVGEKNGWGKLKSGAGWICLKYTKRV